MFEKCFNGEYGFKLDDNVSGKEYKVNQSTTLSLSYFGVLIESDSRWKNLKVEIEKNNKKETLIDSEREPGKFAESYLIDGGLKSFKYYYSFDDVNYDIDKIEAVFVNGKKLTD